MHGATSAIYMQVNEVSLYNDHLITNEYRFFTHKNSFICFSGQVNHTLTMCESCNYYLRSYNHTKEKELDLYVMKKLFLLISGGLFFCMSVSGQVNTDSLSLVSEISQDQLKLGKLKNQLEQQENNNKNASEKAQSAANQNSTAADKLSDNPNNKNLARKAKNRAVDARKDSRRARNESKMLDKMNRDILYLENRIAANQVKLNKHIKVGTYRMANDSIPFDKSF